ncbi:sugar transferase [Gryllotalpicola reticulitermitis]|uniref:Sugar transferase n=1 Tax=Gryllotalpicola reticulitermitis TaxID=1184153 RepID=A0ABV8Q5U2_9MICO
MTTNAQPSLLPIAGVLPNPPRVEIRRSPEARLSRHYLTRLRITDAGVIALAMGTTLFIRLVIDGGWSGAASLSAGPACAAVGVAWYLVLGLIGCRDHRLFGIGTAEYRHLLSGSVVTFGFVGITDIILGNELGREYLVAFPIGVAGLFLTRWGWRRWLVSTRTETRYLRRAIVVGARADVNYVLGQMHSMGGPAYNVVGAALDNPGDAEESIGDKRVPVLCGYDGVARAATITEADAVIVATLPPGDPEFVRNLSWSLERCGADLVLASRLVDVAGPRMRFMPVPGLPLINVAIPRFDGGKHALKRLIDITLAGLALIVLSPVLGAAALAIKLDDGGPVFFRQVRVGRDGSRFHIVKFRSMVPDAEARLASLAAAQDSGNGVLFKLKDDPRITRVGHFLRAHSIDELPQLWNVVTGQMSLVGPRPPLPSEVEKYEQHVHRRLFIKPGITGMWQVNGRSDLDWAESVRLDLYYVENWSLAGDLVILWRTAKVVLHAEGAY